MQGDALMAWLERKGNVFQVSFRWDGRKFRRSLGTTEKVDADARVARIDRRLQLIEQGDLVVPDGTDLLTFLMTDGKPQPKIVLPTKELTLAELFEQYRTTLPADSMERNSWYTVTIHLKHLEALLGANFSVVKLTMVDLQKYVDGRMKQPGRRGRMLSPTTIKKELTSFSGVWTWAIPRGLVSGPFPNKGLRYSKIDHKQPFQTRQEIERQIGRGGLSEVEQAELWDALYLGLDEIDQVLQHVQSHAQHPFLFPMMLMAAHTGARRSELIRSQVADFDFAAGVVHIREKKRVRGKRSLRSVPLSQRLQKVMTEWLDGVTGRHTFGMNGEPLSVREAYDQFKRTLAGSAWKNVRGWHVFRHSFISNCAAKGLDQRIIDAWAGHQTEEMRRRYTHLFPNVQQAAIRSVFER